METDNETKRSSSKRKKLSLGNGVSLEQMLEGWTQCNHLMASKGRLCNVGRAPNSLYCGNHRPVTEMESVPTRVLKKAKREGQDTIVRIPCPIDNSHTIFKHDLEHHVKICNTAARAAEMKSQPYYCENCNSGHNVATSPAESVDTNELVRKLRRIYEDHVAPFVCEPAETTRIIPVDTILKAVAGTATSFGRIRHAEQNVDIVRQMVAADLLQLAQEIVPNTGAPKDSALTYVELGAGKGMLGLAVKSASRSDSQLVLVERMGCKRKADKVLRDSNLDEFFARVRMDIRHCLLSALPFVTSTKEQEESSGSTTRKRLGDDQKTVIIAKHLCGLATDISLRSLQTFSAEFSNGSAKPDELVTKNAHGVAIATCCHHACSWVDYTGADWLQSLGITSQEFEVMKVWSSWAHTLTKKIRTAEDLQARKEADVLSHAEVIKCETVSEEIRKEVEVEVEEEEEEGDNADNDHNVNIALASSVPRPAGISLKEMSVVGCMVKRIFDQGRVAYLQRLGMRAHQRRYCDRVLSPECYMIIAVASSSS